MIYFLPAIQPASTAQLIIWVVVVKSSKDFHSLPQAPIPSSRHFLLILQIWGRFINATQLLAKAPATLSSRHFLLIPQIWDRFINATQLALIVYKTIICQMMQMQVLISRFWDEEQ